jgi:glutaconate CoA-transferase subunit B
MSVLSADLTAVAVLARMLEGRAHPLVGTNAPVQATAALLARARSGGAMRLTMLGSRKYSFLTEDLGELFESAARGVYDAFFVGGGQIDGQANVNLVGLGEYPNLTKRWPGSHGTPLLYMMIPNVILSPRGRHDRQTLVERVDFISAPGISPPDVFRPGGPIAMVTSRCVFDFHKLPGRFALRSLHPGHTTAEVRENTGFDYDAPDVVAETAPPSRDLLALLKSDVLGEVAVLYPQFAARLSAEIDGMFDG